MSKILVVDDEFTVRYAIRTVLESAGHEVVEAGDGLEALSMLSTTPVDLVVIDIIMPKKEGLETTADIRRDHPDTKIVVVSGGGKSSPLDYMEAARSLGAHATLKKPFTDDQLLDIVSHAMQG